jgi:hypothetical protein
METFTNACRNNNFSVVKNIIETTDIITVIGYEFAFRMACYYGDLKFIKWFFSYQNNFPDRYQDILLEARYPSGILYAVIENHTKLLTWLVRQKFKKADNISNATLFSWAVGKWHTNIINIMVEESWFYDTVYYYCEGIGYIINIQKIPHMENKSYNGINIIHIGPYNKKIIEDFMGTIKKPKSAYSIIDYP